MRELLLAVPSPSVYFTSVGDGERVAESGCNFDEFFFRGKLDWLWDFGALEGRVVGAIGERSVLVSGGVVFEIEAALTEGVVAHHPDIACVVEG